MSSLQPDSTVQNCIFILHTKINIHIVLFVWEITTTDVPTVRCWVPVGAGWWRTPWPRSWWSCAGAGRHSAGPPRTRAGEVPGANLPVASPAHPSLRHWSGIEMCWWQERNMRSAAIALRKFWASSFCSGICVFVYIEMGRLW